MFNKYLLAFVTTVLTLTVLPSLSSAQLLPLITITEHESKPSFWWSSQGGKLSSIERQLLAPLREAGVATIDPAALTNPPKISRVYRRARLSHANATNLAGLYSAAWVAVGSATLKPVDDAKTAGLEGREVALDVTVLSVNGRKVLTQVSVTRRAYETSAALAQKKALNQALVDAGAMMRSTFAGLSNTVGLDERDEPYMVISGLWTVDTLTALQRECVRRKGVKQVVPAWIAEGLVGFDINPNQEDSHSSIKALAQTLLDNPPEGMRFSPTAGAPGSIELRIERAPQE